MNRKFLVVLAVILLVIITGCTYEKESDTVKSDALKFKEEYEMINDQEVTGSDKRYRTLDIPEENPFIYADADNILTMMDNGETFVVYFGFAECPWCRSVLPSLIDVSMDLKIDKIYYVDVADIRDKLEVSQDGKVSVTKEGSEGYIALLKRFDSVLDDYILTYEGEEIDTGEKRIYAPSVISVVNGEAKELETGISEEQEDAYMDLTDEMRRETYNKFKCSIDCVLKSKNSCSSKNAC